MTDGQDNIGMRWALMLVLYELYYVDSIEDAKFNENTERYYRQMPLEKRRRIHKGMAWALDNPGLEFNMFLPNQTRFSNAAIVGFIDRMKRGFEEFQLIEAES
jgi:IS5 family transposase